MLRGTATLFPSVSTSVTLSKSQEMEGLAGVVNLHTYPVQDPASKEFSQLAAECRKTFLRDGIVTLPGFLTEEALAVTVEEVEKAKDAAWHTNTTHNIFLDSGDSSMPMDHIRNRCLHPKMSST